MDSPTTFLFYKHIRPEDRIYPPMTEEEFDRFVHGWHERKAMDRTEAFDFYKRKGWAVRGYRSLNKFIKYELEMQRSAFYRLIISAQVEEDLQLASGRHIPESHSMELSVLIDSADRRAAYAYAKKLAAHTKYKGKSKILQGKITSALVRKAVRHLQGLMEPQEREKAYDAESSARYDRKENNIQSVKYYPMAGLIQIVEKTGNAITVKYYPMDAAITVEDGMPVDPESEEVDA